MEVLQNQLDCTRCSFHGSDFKSTQIHMGTIHPEFCEEIDTGGLGKLVFYQKSARLFHCHRCFFTSKMFANVYYHILNQHAVSDKWSNETKKPIVEPKSEPATEADSEKNDSESLESEDDKYVKENDESKTTDAVKSEENDTLTSWPEKAPSQDNLENSDSDFKSSSIEKVSEMSADTKDKESSSEPELPESESSNNSSNIIKPSPVMAKLCTDISDNDAASFPSKDIPEFSDDDDDGPALPGGIPHFSEDEETAPQTKESSSEDDPVPDQSRGIEDISEDEMPPEEKPMDNMSEDEAVPTLSKDPIISSSEEENVSAAGKDMDFSEEDEEEAPALQKDIMDFSDEEEEETTTIPKNAMDFSDDEETANATKNIMEFSEGEETTNVSKHVMEFSEEGTTVGLSKDIMEFSEEEDDAPAISKSIMEFSDEDDLCPQSKDMPKYLEGNSTPTQSKDSECTEDAQASVLKGSSPFSEDEIPDEAPSGDQKDIAGTTTNINIPARLPGVHVSEYKATPWSKDRLETINTGDISLTVRDTVDVSDDKDSFVKDEEILKHVKRVKGRFHCLLCDCRPLKRGPILHHLITRHNMPSPFICKTCGKTFVMETHLKNHLASHTKGLYKCHRCNFQTDHPRGFKKHQTHCENRHKEDAIKPVLDFSDVQEAGREEVSSNI